MINRYFDNAIALAEFGCELFLLIIAVVITAFLLRKKIGKWGMHLILLGFPVFALFAGSISKKLPSLTVGLHNVPKNLLIWDQARYFLCFTVIFLALSGAFLSVIRLLNKQKSKTFNMRESFFSTSMIMFLAFCIYILYQAMFILGGNTINAALQTPEIVLVLIIGVILLAFVIFQAGKKIVNFVGRRKCFYIICIFSILVMGQLFLYFMLDFAPYYDTLEVQSQARLMLNTGVIGAYNYTYFSQATINHPITIALYFLFKIGTALGISNYIGFAILFNILLVDLSVFISYKIVSTIMGDRKGLIFLLLAVINPWLYLGALHAYTSAFTMPFIMAELWIILKLISATDKRSKILSILFLGIITTVGAKIRMTAIFPCLAFFVYILFCGKWKIGKGWSKKEIIALVFAFIIGSSVVLGVYSELEKRYVKFDYTDTALPWSHFLLLGQSDNGYWNQSDVDFTVSLKTHLEKIKGDLGVVAERIKERGLGGNISFIEKKLKLWSHGNAYANAAPWQSRSFKRYSYNYLMGSRNDWLDYYCQLYQILMFAGIIIGGLYSISGVKKGSHYIIYFILLGAIVYHILFEMQPTYQLCWENIMMICLLFGIDDFYHRLLLTKKAVDKYSSSEYFVRNVLTGGKSASMVILIIILALSLSYSKYFTKTLFPTIDYTVYQITSTGGVSGTDFIQTFKASNSFNNVELLSGERAKSDKNAVYCMELLNLNGKILAKREFTISPGWTKIKMSFRDIYPDGKETYRLHFYLVSGPQNESFTIYARNEWYLDLYPYGELFVNGHPAKADAQFSVYSTCERIWVKPVIYWTWVILMVGVCVWMYLWFRKQTDSI